MLKIELLLYVCFLASILIAVFWVCMCVSSKHQKNLYEKQKKEYEQLVDYTGIIEGLYEELRSQKHDFLNILFSIHGYVATGQIDEFKKYYSAILEEYSEQQSNQFLSALSLIKHAGIKGILGYKLDHAVSMGIKVYLNVFTTIEFRSIDPISLCKIVGILLDNAVEASGESSEKEVHIGMEDDSVCTSVIISNSYLKNPDLSQIHKRGYSTKGKSRGVGLHNVNRILTQYPFVQLKTTVENNMFFQELILTTDTKLSSQQQEPR